MTSKEIESRIATLEDSALDSVNSPHLATELLRQASIFKYKLNALKERERGGWRGLEKHSGYSLKGFGVFNF